MLRWIVLGFSVAIAAWRLLQARASYHLASLATLNGDRSAAELYRTNGRFDLGLAGIFILFGLAVFVLLRERIRIPGRDATE